MNDIEDADRREGREHGQRSLAYAALVVQLSALGQSSALRAHLSPDQQRTLIHLSEELAKVLKQELPTI